MPKTLRGRLWKSHFPVVLLLAINFFIGLNIVADYGKSWDELDMIAYADDTIAAYKGNPSIPTAESSHPEILNYYGPGYITFTLFVEKTISRLTTDISPDDVYHIMYFLSFQVGIYSLFLINRRFMSPYAAATATLLFSTQPLLFGHAFINPKDIPLMGFFLATIACGFWMSDSMHANIGEDPNDKADKLSQALNRDWEYKKSIFAIWGKRLTILLAAGVVLYLFKSQVNSLIANSIKYLLELNPESPLGSLVGSISEHSDEVPAEAYAIKGIAIFWRVVSVAFIASVAAVLIAILWNLTHTWQSIWRNHIRPYLLEFNLSLPKKILGYLSDPRLIAAGVVLGFTTSIRVIGPFAGGLVVIYLIYRFKHHAVAPAIGYFFIGSIITYLAWPFLWGAPFSRFFQSLSLMSSFSWDNKVLFDGSLYQVTELPWYYVVELLAIQFTEPLIILSIGGAFVALRDGYSGKINRSIIAVLFVWFLLPLMYVIFARPIIYDNFRQLLFFTPPLFILSGFMIEEIARRITRPVVNGILLVAILLPGMYWTVKLHPYQYAYYNSFQGGLEGAYLKYELDYWATSYKEVMDFVNRTVDQNASIVVWGAPHIAANYARADIDIYSSTSIDPERMGEFDYGVILNRQKLTKNLMDAGEPIFEVQRDRAVLSMVIKFTEP